MPIVRTDGVNYEPPPPIAAERLGTTRMEDVTAYLAGEQDEVSTLHLHMTVKGELDRRSVVLASSVCGSGCRRKKTPLDAMREGGYAVPVDILRFAKDGAPSAVATFERPGILLSVVHFFSRLIGRAPALTWLVTMEDGHVLTGTLEGNVDAGGAEQFPAILRLSGRMIVKYTTSPNAEPVDLYSRKDPQFEAEVKAWPPRGSTMSLVNGPIEYFTRDELYNEAARPKLVVRSNTITFQDDDVELLKQRPEITSAEIVRAEEGDAVRLRWVDTRTRVPASEPRVSDFVVYRKFADDDLNGWQRIAVVPAETNEFVDYGFRTGGAAEYVVLHAAKYPFGYLYESLVGRPISVGS